MLGMLGLTLEQDVSDFLQSQQQQQEQAALEAAISENKRDLLNYCRNWLAKASNWRAQSYEGKWDTWQRESESIYDPELASHKEKWQSRIHTGMIASHREAIKAQIFRTICGSRPIAELRRKFEGLPGDEDQSENIRDIILRELERTSFEDVFNDILDDTTNYGDGHCEIFHEERTELRLVKTPQMVPQGSDPQTLAATAAGQLPMAVAGYVDELQPVTVYKGVRIRFLPIRDVFPDPKATRVEGNHIAIRFRMSYGQLVEWANLGFAYADAVAMLRDYNPEEGNKPDEGASQADKGVSDITPERSVYEKKLTFYRLYARIPRKWAVLGAQGAGDDPEELISARVIFHDTALVFVEPAREYDGEPPVYKCDYFPIAGQYYARALPEMLKGAQDVINETVNQRMDNVSLSMNLGGAIHESALVDKNDLVSKPGWFVRIARKFSGSLEAAIKFFQIPDVTAGAYKESFEWERYAQERSSANRITLGTAGQLKDANQTLGGMEMLRQASGEKFAYIATLMEFRFLKKICRAVWKTKYQHITPEDVIAAIGPVRAKTFKLLSPEQIEQDYSYEINGFATMENKALAQMKLGQIHQLFAPYPWYNAMGNFEKLCRAANIEPDSLRYTPEEMEVMLQAQANMQMAQAPMPKPPAGPVGKPGAEQGPSK